MYEKARCTRQLGPKRKENLNIVALSPQIERTLSASLGLDTHQAKFFFELSPPNLNITLAVIKSSTVPQPTGGYNNFSKNSMPKSSSCFNHHIKGW